MTTITTDRVINEIRSRLERNNGSDGMNVVQELARKIDGSEEVQQQALEKALEREAMKAQEQNYVPDAPALKTNVLEYLHTNYRLNGISKG